METITKEREQEVAVPALTPEDVPDVEDIVTDGGRDRDRFEP